MTDDQIKLQQNEEHIACLKEKNVEIQARIDAGKEPKWIAAVASSCGGRLILNLPNLSLESKQRLSEAIATSQKWISFDKHGFWGNSGCQDAGLTNYPNTKIVFGDQDV